MLIHNVDDIISIDISEVGWILVVEKEVMHQAYNFRLLLPDPSVNFPKSCWEQSPP